MRTVKIEYEVVIMSEDEFGKRFPQYKGYALGDGKTLFEQVMAPESYVAAAIATKIGLPAVAGVADEAVDECHRLGREISPFDKQFVGAVICALMESNGFHKTGKKKAIPHKAFSKGEFYSHTDFKLPPLPNAVEV